MLEPGLTFQTAVRAALIASPAVSALVPADHIRAGGTRPDKLPAIILTPGSTEYLGRASGNQFVARVGLDLHIWALEDGPDTARAIGQAAFLALMDAPQTHASSFLFIECERPVSACLRDPQPEQSYTHGIMSLEAVLQWSLA